MPEANENSPLNIERIRTTANQKLRYESQIMPDDPVLAVLTLNQALFQEYLDALKLALIEAQTAQNNAVMKHTDSLRLSSTAVVESSIAQLTTQLEQIGVEWQSKFQQAVEQEIGQVQQLTQITYWAAMCWFLAGAITAGVLLIRIFIS